MRVAHVGDIVDAIEIRTAAGIVQVLLPTPDDVQRLAVGETERGAQRVSARGGERSGCLRAEGEAASAAEDLVGPTGRQGGQTLEQRPGRLVRDVEIVVAGRLAGLPGGVADARAEARGGECVEGNCLVPVPEAKDLAALNAQLLAACVANRDRTISGKSMTVGEASQYERAFLAPRAEEGFPLEEGLSPLVVDGKGREGEAQLVFGAVAARAAGVGGGGAVAD